MAALMLLMAIIVTVISYSSLRATYLRLYNEKAQDLVRMLASEVDGDRIAGYVDTGEKDEYYAWLENEFSRVKSEFTGIQYLYLFQPHDDHFIYVVEGFKPGDDPDVASFLGDVYQYSETDYKYLVPDIQAGRASTGLIQGTDVGYGQTISAWAPVLDAQGRVAGMVEADCILSNLNSVVRGYAMRIIGVMLACILVVLFLALQILRGNITEPLKKLTGMVDSYEHGVFSEARFRYDDEIQSLASSFADMTRRIDAYTDEIARATADQERIRAEFNVAQQIQTDILPNKFPAFPDRKEFDIVAAIESCQEIGGEFYDFFLVDNDHLAMVVGDTSDTGVPAALFMVILQTLIKNRTMQGFSPAEVLQNVNEQLLEGNRSGMFATVWFAVLELSSGKGIATNAGNEHPILRRAGKKFELVEYQHSPPVGAKAGTRIRDHGFQLEPGDTVFIFTHGLKELCSEKDEIFGTEHILEALNRDPEASPSVLLQTMKASVERFSGDAPRIDGMTMLSLKYYGPDGASDTWR